MLDTLFHFAPPYATSNCLDIERTVVYPLPEGMSPFERPEFKEPPTVVRLEGKTFYGIHEFKPWNFLVARFPAHCTDRLPL